MNRPEPLTCRNLKQGVTGRGESSPCFQRPEGGPGRTGDVFPRESPLKPILPPSFLIWGGEGGEAASGDSLGPNGDSLGPNGDSNGKRLGS